ncbi:hypothetical protein [Novosphingobium sp. BL-52-GroH]|uniref:hypothetical protein n=1 Tax=Novosphingobium sp. BL-52-GroH TaxID=3349877 RepID=UPI00384E3EB2
MLPKTLALTARHAGERLLVKAVRQLAAAPPARVEGRAMLERAGISERGVSTLAALVALLPDMAPHLRLHGVGSPFVSTGEIVLLGELGRRQRLSPQVFGPGVHWPLSVDPSLDVLLRAAAAALRNADLTIPHRTISSAADLARGMTTRRGAIR